LPITKRQKTQHIYLKERVFKFWVTLSVLFSLTACTGFVSVEEKFDSGAGFSAGHKIHVVQKSETLFSLAWRYGWDYKSLASANSIAAPYIIHPGQKLQVGHSKSSLISNSNSKSKRLTNTSKSSTRNVASARKSTQKPPKSASSGSKSPKSWNKGASPKWSWPAKGQLIAKFSAKSPANKGIDIAGRLGESVTAAAAGSVVYAGSGLLGYGNLVIIKHNEQYLSAYAHNKRLLVKESQKVKAGQSIAELGSSGTDKVKLHFEIRRQGKPVDPMLYLPKGKN
jgi:lipoprotein NlpD